MRLSLLWRMILPTVAVSMLLMALGLGSAIYVYRTNAQVSERLDHRVAEVLKAEELVIAIRDVRQALDRYHALKLPAYMDEATRSAVAAGKLLQQLRASGTLSADAPLASQVAELPRLIEAAHDAAPDEYAAIRQAITRETLAAAMELLNANRLELTEQSRQNRLLAGRVGTSLALLGVSGAAAGLLAGFGVARGVASSIAELGGSLQSLTASLAAGEPALSPAAGLPELVAAMSQVRAKTEGIVTELERTRETAARADQLAAVGQLAAGIAHELRNPLTAVKLLTDAAIEQHEPLALNELIVVRDEADRMQQMLQTFLDFARPPRLVRRSVDLSDVARQTIELAKSRADRLGVMLVLDATDVVELEADPQQLRQVLVNLIFNAIEAQPGGGRIDVAVRTAGERAIVEVADRGPGISPQIVARLFEPFVSTKETGVGLGLAVSQRIIASHGGRVEGFNPPSGGALFRVELPRVPQPLTVSQTPNHD
ncbi:MAG: hypothetical protein KF688_19265 [Pirellulales bacterium]|nr:hypothetical protein [Pirellulales bacterium]